jgi:hypothetical protein
VIVRRVELTVVLDYGQFSLRFGDADDDLMDALNAALEGDGIGQVGDLVVVLSPHQNNFAMRLAVETSPDEPPDDLDQWQEAFEASVVVTGYGMYYESPTANGEQIDVPPGASRLRIAGRGFVARGWPGSTLPGDEWRIQLWPSETTVDARRLRAWGG